MRMKHATAATLLGITTLGAGGTFAGPIPPAHFTYDVIHGRKVLADCTAFLGSSAGGTCGSEGSSPGYAATSGGIGTPSYLPMLGTGTAVDATSDWKSGAWVFSNAAMTYSFEATGPAGDNLIPIDVLSTGLIGSSRDAAAYLSLVISGPDSGHQGPLLDLTALCLGDNCFSDWSTPSHELTDGLCVVNGDIYTVTIEAATAAGPGKRRRWHQDGGASAELDPKIILDPPTVADCPLTGSLSEYTLETGPGASTGYLASAVPEPSVLSLAALGALGLAGALGLHRRRAQDDSGR
jgi:hypothetical protein